MPDGNRVDRPSELLRAVDRRRDVVRRIREGPLDRGAIVDGADASRSTVDRALHTLERLGIVERDGSEYGLTAFGEHVVAEYERTRGRLASLRRAKPVLEAMPASAGIDPAAFGDATYVVGAKPNPFEPVSRIAELVAEATAVRGLCSLVHPTLLGIVERRVLAGDLEFEAVVEATACRYLRSEFPGTYRDLTAAPGCTLYEIDADPDLAYGLVRTADGERGTLLTRDDGGNVDTLVITDADDAKRWIAARYRDDRSRARPPAAVD